MRLSNVQKTVNMERTKRILAVDFGTKRIGIAISDENAEIAQPLTVLKREGNKKDIEKIAKIVQQYNVSVILVGIPYKAEGALTKMGEKAHAFGVLLGECIKKEVIFVDETMTTFVAEEALVQSNVKRKKRKELIDKVAASIILQDFLSRRGI